MRRTTILGVLVITLLVGIGVYLAPLDPNILHLQFAFSEQSFNAVLSKWQSGGLALYRSHIPGDFLLLTTYGVFGFQFGRERRSALAAQPWLAACLTWALPLAAVADATEDVLHLVLTGANAPTNSALYLLSGSAASIKWLGIGIFIVCILISRKKRA